MSQAQTRTDAVLSGPATSFPLCPLWWRKAGMETGGLIARSLSALPGSTGQEIPQIPGL